MVHRGFVQYSFHGMLDIPTDYIESLQTLTST
jgi:hypothetical protein